jgi:PHD/YefM family antitoxin component YafN of YafNO toxin-antitoxin module
MQQMSASRAKQNFGELLEALTRGPVAIERHKTVKAIVCSPETFRDRPDAGHALAQRRAARSAQQLVERDRLIKHQKLAIDLLTMPPAKREKLLEQARAEVARWRQDRLCSVDYADRWDELLRLPVKDLARGMCEDPRGWGRGLRQNSPWTFVQPQ